MAFDYYFIVWSFFFSKFVSLKYDYFVYGSKVIIHFQILNFFLKFSMSTVGTHQTYNHEIVTTISTFVVVLLFSASIYSSFLCLDIVYCHAICRNFTALKHWKFSQLYDSTVYLLFISSALELGYPCRSFLLAKVSLCVYGKKLQNIIITIF